MLPAYCLNCEDAFWPTESSDSLYCSTECEAQHTNAQGCEECGWEQRNCVCPFTVPHPPVWPNYIDNRERN